MKQALILILALNIYFFSKNLFAILFHMDNYKVHKKRLKQLKFNHAEKSESEIGDMVDKLTQPVISNILPLLNIKDMNAIEKQLRMSQWNKHINGKQLVALKVITKAFGVVMGLILMGSNSFLALVWFIIPFFGVQVLLSNSANNRRDKLLMGFPDFIRITQGYLAANMPFVSAVEESISFVSDEWKPILRNFVIEARLTNVEKALDGIRDEIDAFEVKEFLSLVRLTLEQGGKAKDGFETQAVKVQQMLQDMMIMKIGRRKILGVFIQAPLLLANMAVLGLPTIGSFIDSGL